MSSRLNALINFLQRTLAEPLQRLGMALARSARALAITIFTPAREAR